MAKKTAKKKTKKRAKMVSDQKAMRKAKKSATRAGRSKATKKARTAKKVGKKAPARKKTVRRARSLAPRPVNSGRGLTPAEIGAVVVEAFNEHQPDVELWNQFWADDVESIEGMGVSLAWHGRDAMQAKGETWAADHIVHSANAEGPYVGATGFSIRFRMDVEEKSTGNRMLMEEIGVYTVKNGKVVREEFMYGSVTPVAVGGEMAEVMTTATVEEVIPI